MADSFHNSTRDVSSLEDLSKLLNNPAGTICHRMEFIGDFDNASNIDKVIVKRRLDAFDDEILKIMVCLIGGRMVYSNFDAEEWDAVLGTILFSAPGFDKLDTELFALNKKGQPIHVYVWEAGVPVDEKTLEWLKKTMLFASSTAKFFGGFEGAVARSGTMILSIMKHHEGENIANFLSNNFPMTWFAEEFWPKYKRLVG
jgi:hypothetical protein